MTAVCAGLGVFCLLYYLFLVVHAGILVNFGWFWAALGVLLLFAVFLRRFPDKAAAVWLSRILLAALAAGLIVLGFFSSRVISGMNPSAPANLPYAIVLGAQVKGKTPSLALVQRMDRAFSIAEKSPKLTLILSGGQGEGELISEAQCMREYLTGRGLTEKRLVVEDRSTTTRENLVYSDELTGCAKKKCGIVTNDFHVYRALKLARKAGYQEAYGIASESEDLMKPHYIVREAAALAYEQVRGG